MDTFASTTVLLVRRNGRVCMASDGQVTMNNSTVMKNGARKVRRTGKGQVLVGFAGGGADALALMTRLEEKLDEFGGNLDRAVVELAKEWRTDRAMRQLQAVMLVTDRERTYLVSGSGETPRARSSPSSIASSSGSGGQARGGHRAAQPLAPPAGAAGAARRDRAQEHHHDRADGRRQDRDRPPAGEARRRRS
jgi:ATP-dependent HslUV protease subunit HslV